MKIYKKYFLKSFRSRQEKKRKKSNTWKWKHTIYWVSDLKQKHIQEYGTEKVQIKYNNKSCVRPPKAMRGSSPLSLILSPSSKNPKKRLI